MRTSQVAIAGLTTAAVVVGASVAGCGSHSRSKPPTSGPVASSSATRPSTTQQPGDYTRLLIRAADINAPVTFKAGPPIQNPNGKPGAATTFTDDDGSHVIHDTIEILPDPAAAAGALNATKATPPGPITGTPVKATVGTGGVTISGDLPDKSKGVTVLLFTEGKAFVTLEFDGPTGVPAPPEFVSDVGQKQDAAIKNGLPA
ncbi:hypothetical protein BMW24_022540 [Mycobacterium heckeshornense]|uniref:hypothetical protein n=1 Tax=Mycobacterium heckeshornense TaxID=110505 RepID=UPI0006620E3C|nr:hypothetical protein [Mycobacterium heckeshornense]KMV23292.1 hypothetical protein ACT16_06330 [Mycobacterium heckeshornense]MCV7032818.1 hypothetical protein [Mycobacterium heckeshornense]PIJ30018.1 hypothetical protein BMW24_022540 [Mycobacterium heckeshornense]